MDLSAMKKSDWLMVGGGVGFLIFGTFFDWATFDAGTLEISGANAFDFFLRGTIPWLLVVGTGVLALLLATGVVKRSTAPWPIILLAATGLAALLSVIMVITGPSADGFDDYGRGIGLWLSFVSSVVALAGAVMSFKESGGDLDDLRDVNKLKGAFGRDASEPPPTDPPA